MLMHTCTYVCMYVRNYMYVNIHVFEMTDLKVHTRTYLKVQRTLKIICICKKENNFYESEIIMFDRTIVLAIFHVNIS